MNKKTLYERLRGYDAIAAVVSDLLPRFRGDPQLGHFWQYRSDDNLRRSKQLLVDFLCSSAGGPVYYAGRDMKTSHKGMHISEANWTVFLEHLNNTLDLFKVARAERDDLVAFVQSTRIDMVEA